MPYLCFCTAVQTENVYFNRINRLYYCCDNGQNNNNNLQKQKQCQTTKV